MAERLLKKALSDAGVKGVEVISAGIAAYDGQSASVYAIQALKDAGLDLRDHRSRLLTKQMLEGAGLVLVMASMHMAAILQEFGAPKAPIMLWREFTEGEKQIADPFGSDADTYRHSRDVIAEAVPSWVEWIKKHREL